MLFFHNCLIEIYIGCNNIKKMRGTLNKEKKVMVNYRLRLKLPGSKLNIKLHK